MASNPYVNKVQLADGTTIMDLTPTTAVASDVASGKYFFTASGQLTLGSASGGTAAISVVDTTDTAGGTIRTITALDISDTTAVASDVASGKYFYTADGTKTAGTASGGSGGLEYETGTWTPSEDVANYVISFTNTHTVAPVFYAIFIADSIGTNTSGDNLGITYFNNGQFFGDGAWVNTNGTSTQYAAVLATYKSTSTAGSYTSYRPVFPYTDQDDTNNTYSRYWATETGIRASSGSTSRYWRADRTYKWIAIWAPTS